MPQDEYDTQDSVGLQDAAYLNDSASNDASSTTVSDNRQKLVELFDLFQNLLDYSENFSESMESIDLGLLDDDDVYLKATKVITQVKDLSKKIRNYLLNSFENDAYEKALYAYIMLRTELLTAVKLLRDILKLNEVEENPEKKK